MSKKNNDVGAIVEDLIADQVKKHVYEELGSKNDNTEFETPGPIDDEEEIAKTFSRCTSDEGFYIKIYKRFPVPKEYGGRPMFLCDIDQPEAISDIESEVLKLAKQFNWEDGVYECKLLKRGEPGIKAIRRVTIQVPKPAVAFLGKENGSGNVYEQLSQTAKLIKELTVASTSGSAPNSNPPINPESIMKAVAEAYKAGVDTVSNKQVTPPIDIVALISAIKQLAPPQPKDPDTLNVLKELGVFNKTPEAPKENLLDTLTKLKEVGLLKDNTPTQTNQPSILDQLAQLKTLGLLKDNSAPQEDSLSKTLDTVTKLLPLIQNFGGGSGGEEKGSALIEIIRILGPQVGKIVGDLTSTVKDIVSVKSGGVPSPITTQPMQQIQRPINSFPPPNHNPYQSPPPKISVEENPIQPLPMTEVVRSEEEVSPTTIQQTGLNKEEEEQVFKVIRDIRQAIVAQDVNFYPTLQGLILNSMPEETYENLLNGDMGVDVVIDKAKMYIPELNTLQGRSYLENFIIWAKNAELQVECKVCNEPVTFLNKEEFERDSKCPDCDTALTLSN